MMVVSVRARRHSAFCVSAALTSIIKICVADYWSSANIERTVYG
jgi:hypothetical protein